MPDLPMEFNAVTLVTSHQAKAWSLAEVRQLRELAEEGVPLVAIAKQLHRTISAVRNKAGMHGISLRSVTLTGSREATPRNEMQSVLTAQS